ncbi:MAG: hypothetical protein ACKVY0_19270 [Prosthecobacter sp.]|uniref:hypothetical protein n=1 Tax=Prosthecobacter sp. TaxID=1965333 RepID=UPI00390364B2
MLIQTKHLLTMLVVAGISAAAFPAKAATTVYNAGDILLGFRATSGQGSTTNLLVNIGSSTTLRDSTSQISLINIGDTLTSVYGSGWASSTVLNWGLIGVGDTDPGGLVVNGDPNNTLYLSLPQSPVGNAPTIGAKKSTAFTLGGDGAVLSVGGAMSGVQATFAAFNGTADNSGRAAQIDTSTSNTWNSYATSGNDFNTGKNMEGLMSNTAGQVLDLYRVLRDVTVSGAAETSGAVSRRTEWQGTISLSDSGQVTFDASPAAVPEPSRVLFLACGLASLVLRRRRAVRA